MGTNRQEREERQEGSFLELAITDVLLGDLGVLGGFMNP
jgi:hypothetical protein